MEFYIFAFLILLSIIGQWIWYRFWNQKHQRQKLEAIDSQILAWESGALDVDYSNQNGWLDLVLLGKNLGYRRYWTPKNVTVEKHETFKSFNFTYSPFYFVTFNSLKGVVVQFKTDVNLPDFLMIDDQLPSAWHHQDRIELSADTQNKRYMSGLKIFGEAAGAEQNVQTFLEQHHYFKGIRDLPHWVKLYAHDNFVALYFSADIQKDGEHATALFSLDEKLAHLILGDAAVDPAEEIGRLKEQASRDNLRFD